jgi:hypothetical protein
MSTHRARQCRHSSHVSMRRLARNPGIVPVRVEPAAPRHPMGIARHIPPMHVGLTHLRRA